MLGACHVSARLIKCLCFWPAPNLAYYAIHSCESILGRNVPAPYYAGAYYVCAKIAGMEREGRGTAQDASTLLGTNVIRTLIMLRKRKLAQLTRTLRIFIGF